MQSFHQWQIFENRAVVNTKWLRVIKADSAILCIWKQLVRNWEKDFLAAGLLMSLLTIFNLDFLVVQSWCPISCCMVMFWDHQSVCEGVTWTVRSHRDRDQSRRNALPKKKNSM